MSNLRDRLEAFFRANPNTWIDGRELSTIAGSYAWRTRCSELRTIRGLNVENRVRTERLRNGSRVKVSEYRLVVPVGQMSLLEAR